jgi:hypothetical protein
LYLVPVVALGVSWVWLGERQLAVCPDGGNGLGVADGGLEVEKRAFAVQSCEISGESAVGGDRSVAGDDDWDWGAANGSCHGTDAVGSSNGAGQLAVAASGAVRDRRQLRPHFPLKRVPTRSSRRSKRRREAVKYSSSWWATSSK